MQYRKVEGTHSLLARMHRQIAVWICIGPYFLTSPERKKSYEKREREQERERERERKSWLSSFRFSSGSSFGPYPVFSQPLPRHQVCIVSNWSVQCTFIIIISILLFFNPTTQVNAGHSPPPSFPYASNIGGIHHIYIYDYVAIKFVLSIIFSEKKAKKHTKTNIFNVDEVTYWVTVSPCPCGVVPHCAFV